MPCKNCGSYAINPDHHGRDGTDLDLCDVCYWRKRSEDAQAEIRNNSALVNACHTFINSPISVESCKKFSETFAAVKGK